jgi:hypothetical protein
MTTARFWHYHVGAVLIKLEAGQTVTHSSGGQTDEGYSWATNTYSFDGKTVTCEWSTDSRDCDGRYTSSGTSYCPLARLGGGYREDEIAYPAWEPGDARQRDYSAEAMGY